MGSARPRAIDCWLNVPRRVRRLPARVPGPGRARLLQAREGDLRAGAAPGAAAPDGRGRASSAPIITIDAQRPGALRRDRRRRSPASSCPRRWSTRLQGMETLRLIERLATQARPRPGAHRALPGEPAARTTRRTIPSTRSASSSACRSRSTPASRDRRCRPSRSARSTWTRCASSSRSSTLIMAHGADPWWGEAIRLLLKYPNLYMMTSAYAPKYLPAELIQFMNTRGTQKVLFASDHPVLSVRALPRARPRRCRSARACSSSTCARTRCASSAGPIDAG